MDTGEQTQHFLTRVPIFVGAAKLRGPIDLVGVISVISDRPIGALNRRTIATVYAAAYTTGTMAFGGGIAGTLVEVGGDLNVGVGVRGWVGRAGQ